MDGTVVRWWECGLRAPCDAITTYWFPAAVRHPRSWLNICRIICIYIFIYSNRARTISTPTNELPISFGSFHHIITDSHTRTYTHACTMRRAHWAILLSVNASITLRLKIAMSISPRTLGSYNGRQMILQTLRLSACFGIFEHQYSKWYRARQAQRQTTSWGIFDWRFCSGDSLSEKKDWWLSEKTQWDGVCFLPNVIGLIHVRLFDAQSAPRICRDPFDPESLNFTRTSKPT